MRASTLYRLLAVAAAAVCVFAGGASAQLQGSYKPDGKCVPSATCCCSTGTTTVTSEPPNDSVTVNGPLDGGTGCHGFTTLSSVFSYFPHIFYQAINATAASWTVPVYGDKYVAVSAADYSTIRVQRVDISTGCTNLLTKVAGSSTPATGSGTGADSGSSSGGGGGGSSPAPQTCPVTTTGGLEVGRFDPTGSPVVMADGTSEGYIQPDSTHYARYGVIKATGAQDTYDLWLIIDPTTSLFASSLQGKSATVYFIAPTTADSATAVMANPLVKAMTAADSAATQRQWKYASVRVPPGLGLRFAFTYKLSSGEVIDTPTFFFRAQGAAPATSTSTGTGSSTSPLSSTTPPLTTGVPTSTLTAAEARVDAWMGVFGVDTSRCVASDSCCCAKGNIIADYVPGDTGKVRIKSTLDGSNTCGGMTDVTGDFTLTGDRTATYKYPDSPLILNAVLTPDGKTLEFSNNMYSCKSYGVMQSKKNYPAASTPAATPATSTPSSGSSGSSSVDRSGYTGLWASDGSCVPSANCCCLVGNMHVMTPQQAQAEAGYVGDAAVMSNPAALYASGRLDGGIACFRRTDMAGICTIDSPSRSTCKLEGINFNATLAGDRLRITNSMYQNCITTVVKKSNTQTSAARDDGLARVVYSAAAAVGVGALLTL